MMKSQLRVGVLAVQGAFIEHERAFARAGHEVFEIRQLRDIEQPFDALVLPGGESTVQRRLIHDLGLQEPLLARIDSGIRVFATCAGLILLAREVDGAPNPIGRLDVSVRRNAYGRQLGSFTAVGRFGEREHVSMTFIRAPKIEHINSPNVEILSEFDGAATAVKQDNIIACAWHPELNESEELLPDLI